MDITKIKQGDTYKNYKELCLALGEEPKTSNSKKAQMKEWERYFKFTKQGHKFMINKIYETPQIKNDSRSNGNNVSAYMDSIEMLILDLLAQEKHRGQLFLSRNKLLKELKMINENYTYYRNRKLNLSKFMNIGMEEINDFYESSISTFKSNLETALNRLQKQSLIFWNYALTICYIDTRIEMTDTGEVKAVKREKLTDDGEFITVYDTVKPIQELSYRKATDLEIRIILETERETLKKYKCKDKSELYKKGFIEDFYNEVKEIVFDKTNIIFYYKSYEVIFNDEHIQERIEEMKLMEHEREFTQSLLNKGVINKMHDNAKKRYEKAEFEYILNGFDEINLKEKVKIRSSNTYIENNGALTNKLIDKNSSIDYLN